MRAFAVPEFNGTGSVTEVPIPQPGEGQILVRVRAAGVNPMDPIAVSGAMKEMLPHRLPLVPGFDYAGDIESVGPGVETLRVGDEVFGPVGKMVFGEESWAEYVTASAALANPTRDGLGSPAGWRSPSSTRSMQRRGTRSSSWARPVAPGALPSSWQRGPGLA